ncbi:MAG: right-handed parallel beta-helix repeat-containing protein [Actinomycetes bacterium]
MNRAQRRAEARSGRGRAVAALGSAAVLASAGGGAVLVLASSAPAGATGDVFVVSNLLDSGAGSLRDAIDSANLDGSDQDQITFSVSGTITLASDLPTITGPVHVNGPGAGNLAVDGAGSHSAFRFDHIAAADGTREVTGLTVTHALTLGYLGPAISAEHVGADLAIADVVLTANTAGRGGAGINLYHESGRVDITRSVISHNSASFGGGIYVFAEEGEDLVVSIADTSITDNTAHSGGGVYAVDATVVVTDSVISGNTAETGKGGGILVNIDAGSPSLTVVDSTLCGNSAAHGGGLFFEGSDLTVLGSTVSANTAGLYGGGLYITASGDVTIANATITGNTANQASGVATYAAGTTAILQSTITGNAATGADPSRINYPLTAGVQIASGVAPLEVGGRRARYAAAPSDASARRGGHGGDVRTAGDIGPSGPVTVTGTILAGNTGGYDVGLYNTGAVALTETGSIVGTVDPAVTVTDGGRNQNGLTAAALLLGPLADNGGPTFTHALLAGSPAIDAGPSTVPTFDGNGHDQRGVGYARVVAGTVDVGAFEVQPAPEPSFTG